MILFRCFILAWCANGHHVLFHQTLNFLSYHKITSTSFMKSNMTWYMGNCYLLCADVAFFISITSMLCRVIGRTVDAFAACDDFDVSLGVLMSNICIVQEKFWSYRGGGRGKASRWRLINYDKINFNKPFQSQNSFLAWIVSF